MNLMIYMLTMISAIISVLVLFLNFFSKKTNMDREKSSPFECGFDPKSSARIPFSLKFFLIALIFLIFDIEISLLFPMTISINSTNLNEFSILVISLMMILIIGLIHEWNQGSLSWKN